MIVQSDALALPLADESIDLVVTSPPYFGLRSYTDGGEHYDGQIGAEVDPESFLDSLCLAVREMSRVVKPSGSIWVNLGDRYANKSLMGLPWRFALRCIDELGLILRAEVIWSKPNGLPESVTDRVRRSHEQWFHFTQSGDYFCDIDKVREPHVGKRPDGARFGGKRNGNTPRTSLGNSYTEQHPLGKLPSSVWTIATQPLQVPESLGVEHFAAFPMEWPRQIIKGWSPAGGMVLDPFGGTGTTALVAKALGRHGISIDLSSDYCRLAQWRTNDPGEIARARQLPKPPTTDDNQLALI